MSSVASRGYPRRATPWLAASLLLVSGCIGALHSNQPTQQQYVLSWRQQGERVGDTRGGTAVAASAPAAEVAGVGTGAPRAALQVLLPAAAAGLGGAAIAVHRSGQRLDYYSGARWAADAPLLVQMLAIEAVRAQGRFTLVESDTGPFDTPYILSLDLTHFEADYADGGPPTVRVTLICTLGQRADRSVVTTLTAHSAVVADADRMQAVVDAFERATTEALTQMAEAIGPSSGATPASAAAPAGTR